MYPEFKKTDAFVKEAGSILTTSKTLKDIHDSILKRNLKAVAVEFLNEKGKIKNYKYKKAEANSLLYAGYLAKTLKDFPKHSIVGLKAANSPHWIETFWAILRNGFKPLLIGASVNKDGTANLLAQSKAVAIITDDVYQYEVKKISMDDIIYDAESTSFEEEWENEVIFCSSGTTGDSKLMVFNGENLCHQLAAAYNMSEETKDIVYPKRYGKLKILAMIPFHHIFGFVAVFLWYSYYGKTLVFPVSNAPRDLQYICQKAGVTHVYSVPLLWDGTAKSIKRKAEMSGEAKVALLEKMIAYNTGKIGKDEAGIAGSKIAMNKVQKNILGNKVRYCISGGGFISPETLTTINGIGYPLYNGYGMTEIGVTSVELSSDVKDRLKGSIGKPLNGVEYKVLENGELVVKSPITHIREIIAGEEKPTSLEDGFFRTGDIAELDADGRCYLKGRIKDIIVNADGENIFPDEIEIFFKDLPHATNLSVLGKAKPGSKDEDVVLVLELDNTVTDEDIEEIKKQIAEISPKLPYNVVIKQIYLARGKLPVSNTMKVKRVAIKKALEEGTNDYLPIDNKKEIKTFEGFDEETIKNILEPMREIFSKVLILPKFKIEDDAHWINDLGGDSMSYVELITDVQDKFQIEFPEELLGKMANINDFVIEIAKLLKNKQ